MTPRADNESEDTEEKSEGIYRFVDPQGAGQPRADANEY